jgi:ferredoxin
MPKVFFEMESVAVDIEPGQTIYDAAKKARIVLTRGFAEAHSCGGKGFCSGAGCAVQLRAPDQSKAVTPPTWKERFFRRGLLKNRARLACQCSPLRDLTVVTTS